MDFIEVFGFQFHKRIKDMSWKDFNKNYKDNVAFKNKKVSLEDLAKELGIKVPTPKKSKEEE